jgi:pimeloyl-ACP methyl ester carboxylesterase
VVIQKQMKPLLVTVTSILMLAGIIHAQDYDWTADALPGVKINTVAFKGWIPASQKPLRGTLVLIPGRHGDGRGMADDQNWQALGTDIGFAVIGCQFSDGEPFNYQNDPQGEVARSINLAVEHLAKESNHSELAKAPLAFWGTSAGSNVSARYCTRFPKRVIAFASSKGTQGPSGDMPPGKAEIPMFFALGAKDNPDWLKGSQANIGNGTRLHAPWTLAFQKNEGHDVGHSLDVAIPFMKAVVEMRFNGSPVSSSGGSSSIFKTQLPSMGQPAASGGPAATVMLHKIDIRSGWLGNPETYEVVRFSEFKGDRNKGVWLPDETTALAWQQYLKQ